MSNQAYVAITPSDTVPQPGLVTDLYVGGTGDVAVKSTYDSAAVTLTAPVVGAWIHLPHPVLYVMATHTSASNLVGALALSSRSTASNA
jgi:hypothetical protein